jgi:antagonist of KipI
VGGYPVPLVVAGVDLARIGQLRVGDRIRLRHLSPDQARVERLAADARFEQARAALTVMRSVW